MVTPSPNSLFIFTFISNETCGTETRNLCIYVFTKPNTNQIIIDGGDDQVFNN